MQTDTTKLVEMVYQQLAIFLLATAHTFPLNSTHIYSYYNQRILPIYETWGKSFQHLYFILGNNPINQQFVQANCRSFQSLTEQNEIQISRNLKPAVKKNDALVNKTTFHSCGANQQLNVILTWNCSGEYFGIGELIHRYFNYFDL